MCMCLYICIFITLYTYVNKLHCIHIYIHEFPHVHTYVPKYI